MSEGFDTWLDAIPEGGAATAEGFARSAIGTIPAIGTTVRIPTCFPEAHREMLIDDVAKIIERVPFIEVAPASLFTTGLVSELAEASDRLAATVAKLQEKFNADR